MIFCLTKPKEEYVVEVQGLRIGPWPHYRNRPGIFSIMSIFTPILYQWEDGSPVPPMDRHYCFDENFGILVEQTLDTDVMGRSMLNWLGGIKTTTQLAAVFKGVDLSHLPITKRYSTNNLNLIMAARIASAEGRVSDKIKIVKDNAYGKYKNKIH